MGKINLKENNIRYDISDDITSIANVELIDDQSNDLEINIPSGFNVEIVEIVQSARSTKINVAKDAKVTYYIIESFAEEAEIKKNVTVLENGEIDFKIFSLNTGKVHQNIEMDLDEKGATADYKLVAISGAGSENKIDVRLNNNAPATNANIWQKGVVFNGGITDLIATGFIKKGSDKAISYQDSRILLLDDAKRGEASPNLLIDHYNVEAGHKATVSRVDADSMYYLNTRGIAKAEAEKLMIRAFIAPLIDGIEFEDISEIVAGKLKESLGI